MSVNNKRVCPVTRCHNSTHHLSCILCETTHRGYFHWTNVVTYPVMSNWSLACVKVSSGRESHGQEWILFLPVWYTTVMSVVTYNVPRVMHCARVWHIQHYIIKSTSQFAPSICWLISLVWWWWPHDQSSCTLNSWVASSSCSCSASGNQLCSCCCTKCNHGQMFSFNMWTLCVVNLVSNKKIDAEHLSKMFTDKVFVVHQQNIFQVTPTCWESTYRTVQSVQGRCWEKNLQSQNTYRSCNHIRKVSDCPQIYSEWPLLCSVMIWPPQSPMTLIIQPLFILLAVP